jgi:hypothetical protein
MAHQLVDHSSWNAGVFQPGREGVAQIVGTVRIDRNKVVACASDSALVDAAEVVPGQHCARADGDTVAASRAGEDKEVRVAVGRELPTDGLDHHWSEGSSRMPASLLGQGLKPLPNRP